MSRFGEAILERREVLGESGPRLAEESKKLEREDPDKFLAFSQQTLSRWEKDATGEHISASKMKMLATLSYLLKWTSSEFNEKVGVAIGPVPLLEDTTQSNMFSFLERYGEKAGLTVRIGFYGSVAAGVKGFEGHEEPIEYRRFAPEELPKGVDPNKLFLVKANGSSMYEDSVARPVPDGAMLLVEYDALPEVGKLVIAYIPERDLGVIKRYEEKNGNVMLRSYRVGGPVFWSEDYPSMRIIGVVRRVSYDL